MADQSSSIDNSSTGEAREPTILGKKIKRDDFEHLMGFYEADHRLNTEERSVMSKDLTNSGITTMLWALLDSSIVVTTPLIYRRYKERKLGAPLPTPARLPAFFRSVFFSVAGLTVYFWSSKYHAKTDQQYRIASLEADCTSGKFSESETASKQRLLNVWKTLDPGKLSLFTVYYYKTASDPSLAMKSPKDMVSFDPHAVLYVPPPQGKEGPLHNVFGAVKEHEKQAPHWEKIREVNGFIPPKSEDLISPSITDPADASDNVHISEDAKVTENFAFESDSASTGGPCKMAITRVFISGSRLLKLGHSKLGNNFAVSCGARDNALNRLPNIWRFRINTKVFYLAWRWHTESPAMLMKQSLFSSAFRTHRLFSSRSPSVREVGSKPLKVKWYYNTDQPLTKPDWYDYTQEKEPEKFLPFSDYDNARLERAYKSKKKSVDVREDRLFEVELDKMQLSTVYWTGPVYQVRRGTWFTRDGRPLSAQLASKLEEGYNDVKAYRLKAEKATPLSRDLAAKFNKQVKELPSADAVDIAKEEDVVDLGDGQAVIYFNDVHGAIFPKKISALQVNIIRSLQPSYGMLMSVIPIQRGHTKDLDSSIIDSVKSTNVTSLTDIFQSEVASMFSSDKPLSASADTKGEPDQSKLLEKVFEADFKNESCAHTSKRDIEHLVFCVHGVGQLLGYKYESVNFTHSINVMRSTMKEVFANEVKYQELAYGSKLDPKDKSQKANNKIQTLPISWRHRVAFHPRKPGKTESETGKSRIPTLSQINVEGVKSLRNIVGDVILDVLLYYEPMYLRQIMDAVSSELNSVYRAYIERNPDFNGKVHLFGHSLGSAILFDLLSQQKEGENDYKLDFEVENLFCVGSPVGMFEVLKQKNIIPRCQAKESDIKLDADFSSPKCKNIYNIFHPCDPVSYRMEPLVDTKFADLKAEEVPFALKGFNTQVQNLTSLGDDLQEKFYSASSWFRKSQTEESPKPAALTSGAQEENALGDIISTLTSSGQQKSTHRKTRTEVYDEEALGSLLKLNKTGRIDYSLPMGVFSIALVSAISAHISYFEDQETVGFVMKEILSSNEPPVKTRKVTVYGHV